MSCNCRGGPFCCVRASWPDVPAMTGPFQCPDCGTWWAGEHRCPPMQGVLTVGNVRVSITATCTCPPDRGDNYTGTCPIHDSHTTYTGSVSA